MGRTCIKCGHSGTTYKDPSAHLLADAIGFPLGKNTHELTLCRWCIGNYIVTESNRFGVRVRHILEPLRAMFAQDACAYCAHPIIPGDPIERTYIRVNWGKAGECGFRSVHLECAKEADERRRIEPPLSRRERDELLGRVSNRALDEAA